MTNAELTSGDAAAEKKSWWRRAFGEPALWYGSVWLVLGCFSGASALTGDASAYQWVLCGGWLSMGSILLGIAIRDYRLKRGRYWERA